MTRAERSAINKANWARTHGSSGKSKRARASAAVRSGGARRAYVAARREADRLCDGSDADLGNRRCEDALARMDRAEQAWVKASGAAFGPGGW
jgi:hypothetical protein